MELFSTTCTTCGARLKVKSLSAIGQIFNCPKCESMVLVEPPPGWTPPAATDEKPAAPARPSTGGSPRSAGRRAAAAITAAAACQESEAASSVQDVDEQTTTLDEPESDMQQAPWQSPTEARWRRSASLGAAGVGSLVLIAAVWAFLSGDEQPAEIVPDEPVRQEVVQTETSEQPAEPMPAPVEQVEQVAQTPPPVAETETKMQEAPAPEPALPHRWLPAPTRAVLSLRMADLAAHQAAPEVLASGNSPVRQTLAELRTTFGLGPEQIERLTWAATEEAKNSSQLALVIRLAQPLEDDATLVANCRRLEVQLADAFCYQPAPGGWPLPFAVVDAKTVVTAPLEVLSQLSGATDAGASDAQFNELLMKVRGDALAALVVDVRNPSLASRLNWNAPALVSIANMQAWATVRENSAGASLELLPGASPQIALHAACPSQQAAGQVEQALKDLLAASQKKTEALADNLDTAAVADALSSALSGASVKSEGQTVTLELAWKGDHELLAASVLANLPQWRTAEQTDVAAAALPPLKAVPLGPQASAASQPAAAQTESAATAFEQHVARRFEERVPAIVLRGMKLGEFATFLSRMTGIMIALDEPSLTEAGIATTTPVEVELSAATLGEIFNTALEAHGLSYLAEENRLLITTRAKAHAARGANQ